MSDQPVYSGVEAAVEAYISQPSEDSTEAAPEDKEVTEVQTEETLELEPEEAESESEEVLDEDNEEEDTSEDSEEDDEEEEDFLFKVGEGDDEVAITDVEEAKKGYLRQSDYTKKTQEVAKQTKELATEKANLLETKAEYVEALSVMKAASSEQLKDFLGVDWVQLQKDDPIEFEEKQSEFQAAKLAYEQTAQLQETKDLELQKETMQYAQTVRQEEMGKLIEAVPELAETPEMLQEVNTFAQEAYGFTAEDLTSIYDHRQVRVLIDAYKNSTGTKKLESGARRVKNAKTIKPKASSPTTSKQRQAKARNAVLQKPGGISVEDAVEALLN